MLASRAGRHDAHESLVARPAGFADVDGRRLAAHVARPRPCASPRGAALLVRAGDAGPTRVDCVLAAAYAVVGFLAPVSASALERGGAFR